MGIVHVAPAGLGKPAFLNLNEPTDRVGNRELMLVNVAVNVEKLGPVVE